MSLEEKYANKILGVRNYKHEQSEFFVKDFTDLDLLEPILNEMFTGESDISPAGKRFLEEYYGIGNLAELLFRRENIKEMGWSFPSIQEIEEHINNIVPMEAIMFIETARGNISDDSELREDLMPPK